MTFEEKLEKFLQTIEESHKKSEKEVAEIRQLQKEREVESKKEVAEMRQFQKENEAKSEKEWAVIRQQMIDVRKEIGGIGKSNGQVAEETIYNALEKNMTFAGIEFHDIDRNWNRKKTALKLHAEFDIVLVNDDTLALIETKYKVRDTDVTKLVNTTLNNFRILFPQYSGYKIILGVGGMAFEQEAIDTASINGVGLIKIIGDKVEFHTDSVKVY